MAHLPSMKQLHYLVALADYGSFSKAAIQCHVTQPTLSAGIAALENLLGQELVDRTHKHVALTPVGEETVELARDIVSNGINLVERAHYLNNPEAGPLRIGIIPTIAPYLLPQIMPVIQDAFPKLELQLTEDLSERIVAALDKGELDLLIMAFPYGTQGLKHDVLFEEHFMIATPKGQWKKGKPATMKDLKGEKLLLLEEGHCLRDHALDACKLQPKPQKQAFNATSLPTLIQMVQYGHGITLLPEMAIKNAALPDNLDIIPFSAPQPTRSIGLAWRDNSARQALYEKIGQTIGQTIKEAY